MIFGQLSTDQVQEGFGLPAAIVIVALVTALIFTVRLLLRSYDKYDAIQETRIQDAKETRDKITEPLEKQATVSEKTYELLLNFINSRRS